MPQVKFTNPRAKEPNTVLTSREQFGNVEKGFAEADKVIEYTITRARNTPAGVEAIACVAQWRGDFLDLWVHHQDLPQAAVTTANNVREKRRAPLAEWTKITVTMPYQAHGMAASRGFPILMHLSGSPRFWQKELRGTGETAMDESGYYCAATTRDLSVQVGAKRDGTITAYHCICSG